MSEASESVWRGSMPEIYDRCLGSAVFLPHAQDLSARAACLGADRILELAAGSGILTRQLVAALPEARITATDLNPAMVQYGSSQVEGALWQQADAQELPFDDDSFDLVVCQFGVMFVPDKKAAFAGVARVLDHDGRFLFNVWDVVESNDFAAALATALDSAFPEDPPTFVVRIPHGYSSLTQISADLAAGGLGVDDVVTVALIGHGESAAQVAQGFCYGSPVRMAVEARGDLDEAADMVASHMTARLGEGPITGTLTAHVITARPE